MPEAFRFVFRCLTEIGAGNDGLIRSSHLLAALSAARHVLYSAKLKFLECNSPARVTRAVTHFDDVFRV